MYIFNLKHSIPKVEAIMDELMDAPYIRLPSDPKTTRKFGIYIKPLKEQGFLKIYSTPSHDSAYEAIAVLKINNFHKPNNMMKRNGKRIEYIFEDTLIPKTKLPKI